MNYREVERMNNKEMWLQAYESSVEDIMDVMGFDWEAATREIDGILERDPCYLDDYHLTICDAYAN